MRLKIGTAFYSPTAGQRVVVCGVRRLEHTFIADKSLVQYLRERSSDWYPGPDATNVLSKQHDEFEAGAIVTETVESIEMQGIDWVTDFRTLYTKWTIRKEADVSGDEGSGIEAASTTLEGTQPQHGSEPRAGN